MDGISPAIPMGPRPGSAARPPVSTLPTGYRIDDRQPVRIGAPGRGSVVAPEGAWRLLSDPSRSADRNEVPLPFPITPTAWPAPTETATNTIARPLRQVPTWEQR